MNGGPDTGPLSVAQIEVTTIGEAGDSSQVIPRRSEPLEQVHKDRSVINRVYDRS